MWNGWRLLRFQNCVVWVNGVQRKSMCAYHFWAHWIVDSFLFSKMQYLLRSPQPFPGSQRSVPPASWPLQTIGISSTVHQGSIWHWPSPHCSSYSFFPSDSSVMVLIIRLWTAMTWVLREWEQHIWITLTYHCCTSFLWQWSRYRPESAPMAVLHLFEFFWCLRLPTVFCYHWTFADGCSPSVFVFVVLSDSPFLTQGDSADVSATIVTKSSNPDSLAPLGKKIALFKEYMVHFRYLAAHTLLTEIEKDLEGTNHSGDEIDAVCFRQNRPSCILKAFHRRSKNWQHWSRSLGLWRIELQSSWKHMNPLSQMRAGLWVREIPLSLTQLPHSQLVQEYFGVKTYSRYDEDTTHAMWIKVCHVVSVVRTLMANFRWLVISKTPHS